MDCSAGFRSLLVHKSKEKCRRTAVNTAARMVYYINGRKKAGLENLGTHSMRKTFGYHLYKNGVGLELIQVLLNHSSPKITLRYIGIEQEDKDQAVSSLGL